MPVTSSGNALQFADFNGDGLHDYAQAAVIANNQGVSYNGTIFSNTGTKQDLLSKITYPQGGNTAVSYKTAAQYPGNKSPYPLFVVSQITNSDGAGSTFGNTYSYSGGTYYYGSALDRQFAGFGQISQTDAAGYATKTYFHTGTGTDSANGEYQDNFYKIGKVYRTENYDNAGNLYRVGINKWDQVSLGAGSNFVKLVRTVGQDFDGLATHRDRAQAFSYDDTTGNLIRKIDYGEVAANTDGSFTDIGSDEYSANYSYAAPVSGSNVTAAVSDVATLDQNSNKVKESRFYYDGLALGSVSLGNQTKQENWVTGSNYAGSQKIYNGYGLVTQSLDPNGNATNFTYDSYNLYPANVTNALNQTVAYIYNYGTGQVSQTTDANNFVFRTTYDGFGRVLQQSQPDLANPASQVPKSSFIYNDSSLNVSVQETDYLDGQTVVTNYSYYDGLGRAIQTKKSARNGNFETKDLIYDTRGNLQKESLPYFASTAAKTSPTSTSQLYTAYVYDALGRKTSSTNTLGTTATSYKNWQTTVTDANSNSKDYFSDAHGNLIKVVEHNGSDAYATAYTYDGQANLLGIIDAAGNVRNFTYDGLGHVLTAQDLHPANAATFGTRSYAYDNAGNLLSLVDSKNQTVNYVYDALNRQKTESAGGVTAKTFTYDNCVDGTGRLCQVVLPDETESFEYNALGGVAKDTKTRDSQAFVTAYAYDRLGNKLSATNPDGSVVKFTYNTAGMAESVSRQESTDPTPLGVIASFDYSPAEQVNAINYASGIATTDTHDASQLYRLTRKLSVAGSANLQDLNYQYDPVGNITQTADNSGTQTRKNAAYGYDKLYRLTSANITNTANSQDYSQAFTYDALGNMLTQKLNDTTLTYSYNGGNNPSGNPDAATSIVTAMPLTAPAIGSFAAAPSVIAAGTPVTLSWTLSGGTPDTLTIDNNIGPVLGTASKTVSPTSTTTYTLTAANAAGTNTATAKVTIVVAPLISTFTASPTPINPGGTSTLAWTLAGGTPDTLTIDNNVGSVTGTSSKSVSPTTSTTYKLTAANVAGSATATVTVNVLAAPIISAFTANPTAIASGQSSTLSWTLGGGATTALSIDNNVGSVMGKTSITVKPTATTTYKLTATNAAGTATAPVTVTIVAKPAINSFNASSTSINQGSSTTLSWTLGGGAVTALSIDNNVGSVLGTTSKSVSPSATTTYKLTATNVAGTVTATVKVTVTVVKPTITVFTASQTTITKGNSTTLSWTLAGSPATALSINQNVGSVLGKTAVSVKPASTTTYTLTATNSAGSATKTVTVTVKMAESTDPFADFASAASKVFCAIADTFSVPVAYAATITITANYQYDANGNLLTDGKTTYTYDYLNRIVTATTGIAANGTVSAYSYDYQGQRDKSLVTVTATDAATGNVTTKSTTTYTPTSNYSTATLVTTVKDKNGNQISTTTAPTEITKHIFANGQMLATVKGTGAAAKVYYDLTDNINGSTVVLDSNNAIVETTDYYPFGAIRFDNQVNYSEKRKYIGQEYDAETTLSYLNARYYNGTIGRFTTEDPVFWGKQNFSDPQSLNTYSYASNKPITLSDPSGLASWSDIQNQLNAISAQVAALTAKVNSFVSAQAKTAVQNISTAAKYASSTINQTAGAAKTQVCNGLTALDKGMTAASNYLNSNSYIGAALFIVGMGEGGNGEFGEIEAESEVAQNAEQGTIQLNGPINNIANRLEHVFERHTSAGAMSIGKSTFNSGEDVVQLIQQGTQQPIVKQISGSNFERIYDLGRNIGVDRATGQQTSIMTVITNKSGNLITAFPGQP